MNLAILGGWFDTYSYGFDVAGWIAYIVIIKGDNDMSKEKFVNAYGFTRGDEFHGWDCTLKVVRTDAGLECVGGNGPSYGAMQRVDDCTIDGSDWLVGGDAIVHFGIRETAKLLHIAKGEARMQ
jgi:hypothetical protein